MPAHNFGKVKDPLTGRFVEATSERGREIVASRLSQHLPSDLPVETESIHVMDTDNHPSDVNITTSDRTVRQREPVSDVGSDRSRRNVSSTDRTDESLMKIAQMMQQSQERMMDNLAKILVKGQDRMIQILDNHTEKTTRLITTALDQRQSRSSEAEAEENVPVPHVPVTTQTNVTEQRAARRTTQGRETSFSLPSRQQSTPFMPQQTEIEPTRQPRHQGSPNRRESSLSSDSRYYRPKPKDIGKFAPSAIPDAEAAERFISSINLWVRKCRNNEEDVTAVLEPCLDNDRATQWYFSLPEDTRNQMQISTNEWIYQLRQTFGVNQVHMLEKAMKETFNWNQGRSPMEYVIRKQSLLRMGGLKDDGSIISSILQGLRSDPILENLIRVRLRSDATDTIDELMSAVKIVQTACKPTQGNFRGQSYSGVKVDQFKQYVPQNSSNVRRPTNNLKKPSETAVRVQSNGEDPKRKWKCRNYPKCGNGEHWDNVCPLGNSSARTTKSFLLSDLNEDDRVGRSDECEYQMAMISIEDKQNHHDSDNESSPSDADTEIVLFGTSNARIQLHSCRRCNKTFGSKQELNRHVVNASHQTSRTKTKNKTQQKAEAFFTNQTAEPVESKAASDANATVGDTIVESTATDHIGDPQKPLQLYSYLTVTFQLLDAPGLKHKACIDSGFGNSGVELSFLENHAPQLLQNTVKLNASKRIVGIGGGSELSTHGVVMPILLTAKNGKRAVIRRLFHVMNQIGVPVLIGNDIISPEKLLCKPWDSEIILLNHGNMVISARARKLNPQSNIPIRATNSISIPARWASPIETQASGKLELGHDYIFEPRMDGRVGSPTGLINYLTNQIFFINASNVPVQIEKGYLLGHAKIVTPEASQTCVMLGLHGKNTDHEDDDLSWIDQEYIPTHKWPTPEGLAVPDPTKTTFNEVNVNTTDDISPEQAELLQKLAKRHRGLFSDDLGIVRQNPDHWLRIPVDSAVERTLKPQAPYRVGPRAEAQIDLDFNKNRQQGRMSACRGSPYSNGVFVVWDPKPRTVVDMRPVNALVPTDGWPLPRQDKVHERLAGMKWISTTDITSSFYQFAIHPEDRYRTAVVSHRGQEMFNVTVMGFKNSIQNLQRFLDETFGEAMWKYLSAYVDNFHIFDAKFEVHLRHIDAVFRKLQDVGITVRGKKTYLGFHKIESLGYVADGLGIYNSDERIAAISHYPVPTNLGALERFIGAMGWNRHLIPFFSQQIRPLEKLKTVLLKEAPKQGQERRSYTSKQKLTLNNCELNAFSIIKELLCKATRLYHFQTDRALYIFVDSSQDWGVGIAVYQTSYSQPDWSHERLPSRTSLRPIVFLSRRTTPSERTLWATDMEMSGLIWAVQKLKYYIEQVPAIVFTDHEPSSAISKLRSIRTTAPGRDNMRLARWAIFLSQFWPNSEQAGLQAPALYIKWKKGDEMVVPDALSRCRPVTIDTEDSVNFLDGQATQISFLGRTEMILRPDLLQAIREGYDSDSFTAKQKRFLIEHGKLTTSQVDENPKKIEHRHSQFIWDSQEQLLFFVDPLDKRHRMVLPVSVQQEFLEAAHDRQAHHGHLRTYHNIVQHYFIRSLGKQVEKYIAHCPQCLVNAPSRHAPFGRLQPVQSPPIPFHTISMDLITDLPEDEGFDTILTLTDKFSKAVRFVPGRKNWKGSQWANAFTVYVLPDWGYPQVTVSDQDKRFTDGFFRALLRAAGTRSITTTAYHPSSDGQAERTNQSLEIALRYYVDAIQGEWVKALPILQLTMNNAVSHTTGKSPNEIILGMNLSSELNANLLPKTQKKGITEAREIARKEAVDTSALAQKLMAMQYDKRHEEPKFNAGDQVLIRLRPKYGYQLVSMRKNKLGPQRTGPFRVIRKVGRGLAYELDLPPEIKIHPVISAIHLEPYPPGDDPFKRTAPPPGPITNSDQPGEELYDVEDVLAHRWSARNKRMELRIWWKGYSRARATWEPADEIEKCVPEICENYWHKVGGRQDHIVDK